MTIHRRRQLQDSQNAFEVCVIAMLITLLLIALVTLAADAIDRGLENDAAALDQQISPEQRALNVAGMNATTLSQQAIITADLERVQGGKP